MVFLMWNELMFPFVMKYTGAYSLSRERDKERGELELEVQWGDSFLSSTPPEIICKHFEIRRIAFPVSEVTGKGCGMN